MPTPQTVADIVSANIRAEIARQKITQAELGNALGLGLGHQAIGARLAGKVRWSVVELVEIARFLDVPLSTLTPDTLTGATP